MNEEVVEVPAGAGGASEAPAGGPEQLMEAVGMIGQLVQENNSMIKEIGNMLAQAMGGGEQAAAGGAGGASGGEDEALRQEAIARLQAGQ